MTETIRANLATPLTLPSGQVIGNRLMKAALSEGLADSAGAPDDRLARLYARWADGGYGLIVTGNVMVDRRHLGEPGNVVVEDDRHLDALTRWSATARHGGARLWMQLNHPGRQANPLAGTDKPVAPSAVAPSIPGLPVPRALSDTEIEEIVERFATAAEIAERAGFDGVQIHGAHGYLVSQFLSPSANRRDDRWGGDIAGRARFLTAIIGAVRTRVSPDFGVGVKLNSADFQRGGFTEDESRAVVAMIAAEPIDLIEISGGSYESPAMMGRPAVAESTRAREAYFLDYAASVRELAGTVPLAVTGGFRSRSAMHDAVADGACDAVGIGRPTAIEPRAPRRLVDGGVDGAAHRLPTRTVSLPLPAAVRVSLPAVRSLEGALDLQWHTDQLHRMGAGDDPDPQRPLWRTAAAAVRRNGLDGIRSRRASGAAATARARRKFRFERAVGRYLANPAVAALTRAGISTTMATHLETVGRRTGRIRAVPVSAAFDPDGAWLISQHGMRSGWALNIAADPAVWIRTPDGWRPGTAQVMPDDDVEARARTFAPHPAAAGATAAAFRALASEPVSVRVTFTDRDETR
ncbi:nitroreductase family deazaflavin-dependent oxidoreductase [Gordonia shandongensis]|uniref:nitroreductase family deazaflavin-dependent oxidoreductase n=1 Tax=Gordonia shandongensis TaxID=376351 RepID=UPI000403AF73|nr:nitroreductase family deazaflavin-dependent oxidoreductase [Gordonia shandongensis]